jgi:hypothetical protein
MRHQNPKDRRCTYVVVIDGGDGSGDLRELAQYLSSIQLEDCEVVVVDGSAADVFERNQRVLRWVGRHVAAAPRHRMVAGGIDIIRAAAAAASCEKVLVADVSVRYSPPELDELCTLLDTHEVVEPQDYLEPMPWWGSIDAGRMLVHRGIEPYPDHGSTFGFRKSAVRGLRGLELEIEEQSDDHARRLAAQGAEVFAASEVFVRRNPPELREWWQQRPRLAYDDFEMPVKSAFFFGLLPMALLLVAFGGLRLAASYAGAVAFASVALAMRGRSGAAAYFPVRACLSAPLWVLERSVSVYWALFQRLRVVATVPGGVHAAEGLTKRVASGE